GRLGRDDARLGHADVAATATALLGVGDGRTLHRPLHRARAAAGADVEFAQAELVADLLGVHVLLAVDRVPAPADDQVRVGRLQHARVAQQAEHRVGDALAGVEVTSALLVQLDRPVGQVAHRRRQQLGDTADD